MLEVWKDIIDFEDSYMISNYGKVKSLCRIIIKCNGRQQTIPETILKSVYDKNGYEHVRLFKNGKVFVKIVHRLVAIAFIPNPLNKETVNHKDLNKKYNKVNNLEWMTQQENIQHYIKHDFRYASRI